MKKYVFVCGIAVALMASCTNKKSNQQPDDLIVEETLTEEPVQYMETTQVAEIDSLGYYGVYEGSTPVGGKTMKTKLVLYDNDRYLIEPVEIGEDYETETEEGTYMVHGDLLTLVPDHNGSRRYYQSRDGDMTEVDENRQVIPTQHANNFRMLKEVD